LLFRNGADLNALDQFDKTALDYATSTEIIDFLNFNGAVKGSDL
jgi:hypothetical protein